MEFFAEILTCLIIAFVLIPAFFGAILKGIIAGKKPSCSNTTIGFIYNPDSRKLENDQDVITK